jgi:hypothetical protein
MEILLIALVLMIYFWPTAQAIINGHHNAVAIFVLNLFLGWLLIPWVCALVWAYSRPAPIAAPCKRRAPRMVRGELVRSAWS